jgi:hypothetical protein
MSDPALLKNTYLPQYLAGGKQRFYRSLLTYGLSKMILMQGEKFRGIAPDVELLEYHDIFLFLYRREGDQAFLDMSKIFRKAAHKLHRVMLKKEMTYRNPVFLNLV